MQTKALLECALAFVFAAVMIGTPAKAQRVMDCREQLMRASDHLGHMSERFGSQSEAARNARFDLERIRDWCARQNHDRWNRAGHDRDGNDHHWHGDRGGPRP